MDTSPISKALAHIMNTSIATTTFPGDWKHTEVNVLLKKPLSDPSQLANYRLISLLPFTGKVMEKTINKQHTNHLDLLQLMDSSQSGFRANHSTETTLIAASDNIRMILDRGETWALIQLNLLAAFDTVSHSTLIRDRKERRVGKECRL